MGLDFKLCGTLHKPEHKAITVGIAAVATVSGGLSKMAPKEVQDHPVEAIIDGGHYAWSHTKGLLDGHKTPDNLVTLLEIAQKHASKNENTDNEPSQSGPKIN